MLARCDACGRPFVTSRPGHQACPVCGAPVDVDALPGQAVPPAPETPVAPRAPVETPRAVPVDDPAQLGNLALLAAMLWSPRVVMARASGIPVGRALRFGYLCTLWGLLGLSAREAMAAAPEIPADAGAQLRCILGEVAALHDVFRPWLLARLPLSPVLALGVAYGSVHLFHLVVTAMGRTDVPREEAARLVGLALAPMAVASLPVVAFGGCLIWSMVLCALALERAYRLPLPLATGVAALPVFAWAAWELLWQVRVALPCLSLA